MDDHGGKAMITWMIMDRNPQTGEITFTLVKVVLLTPLNQGICELNLLVPHLKKMTSQFVPNFVSYNTIE